MAKSRGVKAGGRPPGQTRAPSRMGRIVLLLVGFVLAAVGVSFRRVYGVSQAKAISELEQKREALVSEQLKLQDAIRVASDRQHIQAIAQSRLNMRIPAPNQVIFIPRRPLGPVRDSVRP
jgi:cell division protein FtsL